MSRGKLHNNCRNIQYSQLSHESFSNREMNAMNNRELGLLLHKDFIASASNAFLILISDVAIERAAKKREKKQLIFASTSSFMYEINVTFYSHHKMLKRWNVWKFIKMNVCLFLLFHCSRCLQSRRDLFHHFCKCAKEHLEDED